MKKKPVNKKFTPSSWEQERDRIKTLWITCTIGFWISVIVQVVLYLTKGEISFVLVSVVGGLMVLGLAMKIRYQHFLRRKPGA